MEHGTMLAKYGNLRMYPVCNINFDKTPKNTSIKVKQKNRGESSLDFVNYYKSQG